MVRKVISKKRYVIVFIITIFIFFLGLLLGIALEESKIEFIQATNQKQKMDFTSLQLQYSYLDSLTNKSESCAAIQTALKSNLEELDRSLSRVISLREQNTLVSEDYEDIEREYILDNIRYWFFVKQAKEKCKLDVVTVLYFFKENNCEKCGDQGMLLSYLKKMLGEKFLVFPLDVEVTEPMLALLSSEYNVTNYPSIIIDGKKYENLLTQEAILDVICPLYISKPEMC